MEHTKEPWHTKREGFSTAYVEARIGGGWVQEVAACGPTANGSDEQEANARRIVACVNACAGIETEALEQHGAFVGSQFKELGDDRDEWKKRYEFSITQRDSLNKLCEFNERTMTELVNTLDSVLEELDKAAKYHASHECYAEAKRVESFIASIKGESA